MTSAELIEIYQALPRLEECDKSERVCLLEGIMNSLVEENQMLRRSRSHHSPCIQPSPSVPVVKIGLYESTGLFTHSARIRSLIDRICASKVQIQWMEYGKPGHSESSVYFFRKGERVSESELERIVTFCSGPSLPIQ